MTPARRNDERGWVLITAIMLMAIMLVFGLAALAFVDNQTKRDRQQRERESSLNLAEAALYQEGFKLAQGWPTQAIPAKDCASTTPDPACPAAAQVQANANNVDTKANSTWTTVVRDNGGPLSAAFAPAQMNAAQSGTDATGKAYSCAAPCNWDANGDRMVWVQASSIVRGRKRTVVATMKLERLAESVPQTAVVAGGINTGNNGSQVKIYAVGSQVTVRCDPSAPNTKGNGHSAPCVSDVGAIQPSATQGNPPPMMTLSQIKRFRDRAINDGTYYAGCSDIPGGSKKNVSGGVVFVENCTDYNMSLDFNNNAAATCSSILPQVTIGGGNPLQPDCINTLTRPGLLIWHCGGLGTSGKGTFMGIMYFVNGSDADPDHPCTPKGTAPVNCDGNSNSDSNVLSTTGGLGILGAVAIDGPGCLYASANGIQVEYDPNVFNAVASYGTVGLVQDTWREMVPN